MLKVLTGKTVRSPISLARLSASRFVLSIIYSRNFTKICQTGTLRRPTVLYFILDSCRVPYLPFLPLRVLCTTTRKPNRTVHREVAHARDSALVSLARYRGAQEARATLCVSWSSRLRLLSCFSLSLLTTHPEERCRYACSDSCLAPLGAPLTVCFPCPFSLAQRAGRASWTCGRGKMTVERLRLRLAAFAEILWGFSLCRRANLPESSLRPRSPADA